MNESLKTLVRLMRYLLDRTRDAPFHDPTARKGRKAFRLTLQQLLHKLLTGKIASADLEPLMKLLDKSGLGDKIKETLDLDGGPGSGNFGHKGRPGEVGGSAPKGNISHGGNDSMTDNEMGSLKRYSHPT